MNIKAIGKALTNKVGGVMASPVVKYHEAKSKSANDRYQVAKTYNDKKKSGVPVTDKENAQFQAVKSYYNKK